MYITTASEFKACGAFFVACHGPNIAVIPVVHKPEEAGLLCGDIVHQHLGGAQEQKPRTGRISVTR